MTNSCAGFFKFSLFCEESNKKYSLLSDKNLTNVWVIFYPGKPMRDSVLQIFIGANQKGNKYQNFRIK
jgi:hypothetical protein